MPAKSLLLTPAPVGGGGTISSGATFFAVVLLTACVLSALPLGKGIVASIGANGSGLPADALAFCLALSIGVASLLADGGLAAALTGS